MDYTSASNWDRALIFDSYETSLKALYGSYNLVARQALPWQLATNCCYIATSKAKGYISASNWDETYATQDFALQLPWALLLVQVTFVREIDLLPLVSAINTLGFACNNFLLQFLSSVPIVCGQYGWHPSQLLQKQHPFLSMKTIKKTWPVQNPRPKIFESNILNLLHQKNSKVPLCSFDTSGNKEEVWVNKWTTEPKICGKILAHRTQNKNSHQCQNSSCSKEQPNCALSKSPQSPGVEGDIFYS